MLFPQKTQLNKILNKQQFCKLANLSPVSKNEINANAERILLANVLRKDTINIEGNVVKEIDVFEIKLKDKKYSDNLIKDIDANIPKHILFMLTYKDEAQIVITYKEKCANSEKYKVLQIYKSKWQKTEDIKLEIKGLSLDKVFENFIEQIAEGRIEVAEEQTMKEAVEKSVANEKLQRKIAQLESKIKKEPQFNRQLELKKELKILKEQLVNI